MITKVKGIFTCSACQILAVASWFSLLGVSSDAVAFTFVTAGESTRLDRVTHPVGYDGTGGVLNISVGIDNAFQFADEMEISTLNALQTWMDLVPTHNNLLFGTNNNIPAGKLDFETVALHELGHALGLGHPNLGDSFLSGSDYTQATDGANNVFDANPGVDGIVGSADDVRGDDGNLNWFRKSNNDPFSIDPVVDSTTYSVNLADLPAGDLYSANPDRTVADQLFGWTNTESVMQQGGTIDTAERTLGHDDVAGIRYAMSGWDEIQGTADDYTINLIYAGFTDQADITMSMDLTSGAFAAFSVPGGSDKHVSILGADVHFSFNENWFFSECTTCDTATWNGSTGAWGDAARWDTNPTIPNNTSVDYDVVINDGTLTLDQNITVEQVDLGTSPTGQATLQIYNQTLDADRVSIGRSAGTNGQAVELDGTGTLNARNYLTVGDEGDGSLTLNSQSHVTAGALYVGRHAGSTGTLTLSSSTSTLDVHSDFVIGSKGNGTLRVENGATFTSAAKVFIGRSVGGHGEVIVTGAGSLMDAPGGFSLGQGGNATVTVENGGALHTDGNLNMAASGGSNVNLNVRGSTGSVSSDGWLVMTGGQIAVEDGASLMTGNFAEIASAAGNSADVTVTGANSQWTVSQHLFVGSRGTGSLTVENGSNVASGFGFGGLRIGWEGVSDGTVTVRDANSQLTSTGPITVGDDGNGALRIESGGFVSTSNDVSIARGTSAMGEVFVTDPNSMLSVGGSLYVGGSSGGSGGKGGLYVSTGGSVSAQDVHIRTGGTVGGDGGSLMANTVFNSGIINPGLSPGSLSLLGDYQESTDGKIVFEIGGLDPMAYDHLSVAGDADFAGEIVFRFIDSFAPSTNDVFDLMHVDGSIATQPTNFSIENLASGFNFSAGFTGDTFSLTALNDGVYMPNLMTQQVFTPIDFSHAHNANVQGNYPNFPQGDVELGGVPFEIPAEGDNRYSAFEEGSGENIVSIDVDIESVSTVYALMNVGWGSPGNSFTRVEFEGADGSFYEKELFDDNDVRGWDLFFSSNINGTTTTEVYREPGDSKVIDMVRFDLPAEFLDTSLISITIFDQTQIGTHTIDLTAITALSTITLIPGDFNNDGNVDGTDFLLWQRGESPNPLSPSDLVDWQTNYGLVASSSTLARQTPEPTTIILMALAIPGLISFRSTAR